MTSGIRFSLLALGIASTGTLLSTTADANPPILQARCQSDSLDIGQAQARLEWARRCGTLINVGSPTTPRTGADAYDTGMFSVTGVPLREYIETFDFWGLNSYSADVAAVNTMFTQNQFRPGPVTTSLAEAAFQKWTQPTALPRPNYPTFGNNSDINVAAQLFPNNNNPNDCNLYDAGGHAVTSFYVNGYCTASCYTPDMSIRFADGEHGILDA